MEGYYNTLLQENNNNQFTVDDLFDFSKEDEVMSDGFFDNFAGNCSDSSNVTAVDSCNSSVSGGETQASGSMSFSGAQFNSEFCVPDDDVAELEWLSNFVDDSSSDHSHIDLHHLNPMCPVITTATSSPMTRPEQTTFPYATSSFPGKARSKRSRAAPCDWSSRLLLLQNEPKSTQARRRDIQDDPDRACLHCGSNKTPQWRAGPMGPKTLCNACGVRYKSGRLVPEYRPASSPSFVPTKHSNSHRKVLELRRQNEVAVFGGTNNGDFNLMNGYHHNGPEYGHMI